MSTLDGIDRNIIRCLRRDGRMTNSQLAAQVGLSQSACLRRVHILEESGVIRGYTAIVGSSDGDERLVAIVRITLDRQTEEYLNRFEEAVRRHPEVQECYLMTGDADYIFGSRPRTRWPTRSFTRKYCPACRVWRASIPVSPSARSCCRKRCRRVPDGQAKVEKSRAVPVEMEPPEPL